MPNKVVKYFKNMTRKLSMVCFAGKTLYQTQIVITDILIGTVGHIKDHLQR
jgi:ATP-dependent RNA helicase DDX50